MTYPISAIKSLSNAPFEKRKIFMTLSGIFLFIITLTVFQDFLESKRSAYSFYFSESLLFKTVWFLFVPILMHLHLRLTKETLDGIFKTFAMIALPLLVHLFILPFVAVILSMWLYGGKYDVLKFFSYTVANDLYKMVIVYSGFVLGYRYFFGRRINPAATESRFSLATIVVNYGKDNVIVNVRDILQITSAKPYICIHLHNKTHLHWETLKSISEQLDENIFIRIHKTTLINISKVISFKSRLNGDYDLLLQNGISVRLSRTYAARFKERFNRGHQLGI